jgi:hypothetical protein
MSDRDVTVAPDDYTAKLMAEVARLEGENERLRQENQSIGIAAYELGRNSLADENARLRELVKDMWPHVRHRSRMCRECELPCDTSDECLLYEPMRQRMRELGIEEDA